MWKYGLSDSAWPLTDKHKQSIRIQLTPLTLSFTWPQWAALVCRHPRQPVGSSGNLPFRISLTLCLEQSKALLMSSHGNNQVNFFKSNKPARTSCYHLISLEIACGFNAAFYFNCFSISLGQDTTVPMFWWGCNIGQIWVNITPLLLGQISLVCLHLEMLDFLSFATVNVNGVVWIVNANLLVWSAVIILFRVHPPDGRLRPVTTCCGPAHWCWAWPPHRQTPDTFPPP